jgi:hypothetical protein
MTKKASLIVWKHIFNCPLFLNMHKLCAEFDISLKTHFFPRDNTVSKFHIDRINESSNIISWVCYHFSEYQLKSKNFLYLENGILNTSDYFYLDCNGYGALSNIVIYGDNKKRYDEDYKKNVFDYLRSIGWPIGSGYEKNGHFLIALQSRTEDDINLLMKCERFLPKNIKVFIRPHPNYLTEEKMNSYKVFCQRNNWEIDSNNNLFSSLKMSRAVITNFSSVIYKAMAMGIPCATCMSGFHSGTGATLECDRNPSMLQYILDLRFDEESAKNLICGIHKNAVSKNSTEKDIITNPNFANWLKRVKDD